MICVSGRSQCRKELVDEGPSSMVVYCSSFVETLFCGDRGRTKHASRDNKEVDLWVLGDNCRCRLLDIGHARDIAMNELV